MRLYEPKAEVRLIKTGPRKELVSGVAVAKSRYADRASYDLTAMLGDGGVVRVAKGVRDPAGAFSISLPDRALPEINETLYAIVEPMDIIEIRMAHDPYAYAKQDEGYSLPVVMRGLVSSVTRSEGMSGGRPVRTVTIAGQDFGKILQIIQIFYLNNSVVGDNILSEFAYFQKFGNPENAKHKQANDFLADLVSSVLDPYLSRLVAKANGGGVKATVTSTWTLDASIDGVVSPYAVSAMNNVSLYSLLTSLLDVGPFNELFVEDRADGIALVVRPAPMLDVSGSAVQGVRPESVDIDSVDVLSINLSRTDAGVANYFWVQNTPWAMYSNELAKSLASVGSADSFIKFDYPNSDKAYFGVRKMEVSTSLLPPEYAGYDAALKSEVKQETRRLGDWIETRRKVLADINKDNVLFEHGSIRVRGNEKIKAGMQLRVSRGGGVLSTYYVTHVDHEFVPMHGFTSLLTVERGTSFINRAQAETAQYRAEIDGKGVR
jgi:hypothetical protein